MLASFPRYSSIILASAGRVVPIAAGNWAPACQMSDATLRNFVEVV
jgi:hypothetical protein